MTRKNRTVKLSTLRIMEILLKDKQVARWSFEDQIKMINKFTQDVLDGKLDSAEDQLGESL